MSEQEPLISSEGQEIPGLPETPPFPPPTLLVSGKEYSLLGLSSPPNEPQHTRFNYFIPDPLLQGFGNSFKSYSEEQLRAIIAENGKTTT
jgi:hypothetical protein